MTLNDEQVIRIEKQIRQRGVRIQDLIESMVDHICCQIEHSEHYDFEKALEEAMSSFNKEEMNEVQKDIQNLEEFRRFKRSRKWFYSLGFAAAFLISTGILFKNMHWPSASICLITGMFTLNFGFLPLYFYDRYKKAQTS